MTIVTEKEAADMRCCGPEGCGISKSSNHITRYCLVGRCMAWRNIGPDIGYCGLAGIPIAALGRGSEE
jgi:hypothetical protein